MRLAWFRGRGVRWGAAQSPADCAALFARRGHYQV